MQDQTRFERVGIHFGRIRTDGVADQVFYVGGVHGQVIDSGVSLGGGVQDNGHAVQRIGRVLGVFWIVHIVHHDGKVGV